MFSSDNCFVTKRKNGKFDLDPLLDLLGYDLFLFRVMGVGFTRDMLLENLNKPKSKRDPKIRGKPSVIDFPEYVDKGFNPTFKINTKIYKKKCMCYSGENPPRGFIRPHVYNLRRRKSPLYITHWYSTKNGTNFFDGCGEGWQIAGSQGFCALYASLYLRNSLPKKDLSRNGHVKNEKAVIRKLITRKFLNFSNFKDWQFCIFKLLKKRVRDIEQIKKFLKEIEINLELTL